MSSVRPSVPTFQNRAQKIQVKIVSLRSGRGDHEWHQSCLVDPRPSTNQSTSLKSGSLFLVMVSVRMYCTYIQITPIKELNHFSSWCFGWCLGVDHAWLKSCFSLFLKNPIFWKETAKGYINAADSFIFLRNLLSQLSCWPLRKNMQKKSGVISDPFGQLHSSFCNRWTQFSLVKNLFYFF